VIFGVLKFPKVRYYNKQVRWHIRPLFDGIFTQQYFCQKLLESDNSCWNYRWWLGGVLFETLCSSGHQPNFAALNRGRHLYSAGRPSRWALAHILVTIIGTPGVLLHFVLRWLWLWIPAVSSHYTKSSSRLYISRNGVYQHRTSYIIVIMLTTAMKWKGNVYIYCTVTLRKSN